MRALLRIGLVASVLALTGCFQADQVLKVNPDGSGTLEVTTLMSDMVLQMMAEMGGGGEGGEGGEAPKPKDPFSEEELKGKAAGMGEGVAYVSSEKVKKDGFAGAKAVYSFTDVTKLKMDAKPNPTGQGGEDDKKDQMAFRFAKSESSSVLTVVMPKKEDKEEAGESHPTGEAGGEGEGEKKEPSEQEMAQMKQMFKGLRFGVSVEVNGTLVKTNSAYVDGSKVTLFEMDFGALIENDAKLKELNTKKPETMEEMQALVKDIPGFKVNIVPEITVEFAGK